MLNTHPWRFQTKTFDNMDGIIFVTICVGQSPICCKTCALLDSDFPSFLRCAKGVPESTLGTKTAMPPGAKMGRKHA